MNTHLPDTFTEPLIQSLKDGFAFYHAGVVEPQCSVFHASLSSSLRASFMMGGKCHSFGFRFEGDLRGAFLLSVDGTLNSSMYAEMGNILASRLASRYPFGTEIVISPPMLLNSKRVASLLKLSSRALQSDFVHRWEGREIRVLTLFLPALLKEEKTSA